ncbi:MAG: AAA family ATPase, partial [Actinomycetota bacterium]
MIARTSSPGGPGAPGPPPPGRLIGGRFKVVRTLKAAEGVESLLATDLEGGGSVVVRVACASHLPEGERMRLGHVATAMAALASPHLTGVVDASATGAQMYVARPYVPGRSLADRLARGPLTVPEALAVGRCLLGGLAEAHARGVLHRHVRPANLILPDSPTVDRATLVDAGLPRAGPVGAGSYALAADEARYLSPEAAGLIERGLDERSDLYSAGLVLFESLAGRPPFRSERVGELLRQHLSTPPPALRTLVAGVPRALDELVARLLRKDPRDRYQSAEVAAADLADIADALRRGDPDPAVPIGARDRRTTLTEPAFVGRDAELAVLDREITETAEGRGGLVALEGLSGGGKTRVLDELATRSAERGAWSLRGGGVDLAARLPFQVLVGIVRQVVSAASVDEALAAAIAGRLGDQAPAACSALPELAEFLGSGRAVELGPEEHGEARSVRALATLLDALGSPGRPCVVLLDDCQWADELSVSLLEAWRRRRDRPGDHCHVLVVAAFRSEEVAAESPLRLLRARTVIDLPALHPGEVRRLAESMAGPLPEDALGPIERLADGNPFMASAVLRGLVESGALVARGEGWDVEPDRLRDLGPSRAATEVLARRLDLMPKGAVAILVAGAVLGKSFEPGLAADLAGQTPHQALEALRDARRRHIVRTDPAGSLWAFSHDKLRETLIAGLAPEERTGYHRRAAERIESLDPDRSFDLAYHFDAAGDPGRALPHALRAAAHARARHALEVAEEHYRIAARGAADADARRAVAEGLGDVLMLRGRYAAAQAELERARTLAGTAAQRAEIDGKLGELAFKRGDVGSASDAYERALRLLECRVPRGRVGFAAAALWEVAVQVAHTLLPRLFLARRTLDGADRELLVIRLYSRLAYPYWFARGAVPTLWAHLRGMNLAERYPPTAELAQAYSEHAPVMTMIPLLGRGVAYAERGLAIRRELGDVWGQGQSLHFYGVVLYAWSRYRECIERCREAVALLERTGDRWEINTANWHIAFCRYRLGDLDEAAAIARLVHEEGLEIGDAQAAGISLGVWAKATGGRVPAAAVAAELGRGDQDVHTTAELLQAEAIRLLADGRPADAADALCRARAAVRAK